MTVSAQDRTFLLMTLANDLIAMAYTLRAERRRFSAHLLRSQQMLHVYLTLSEVAETLERSTAILHDCNFLETSEMSEKSKEMEQQIGRQAAHPGAAQAAGAAAAAKTDQRSAEATSSTAQEATKPTDPTPDTPQSAADQEKQFDNLADQIASAITASLRRLAIEERRLLLDAMPAAIGMRNLVTLLDRLQEKLVAALRKLDLIEQKFTGIGKAIDVIAQAIQRNMPGNNGDPNDNEQGD